MDAGAAGPYSVTSCDVHSGQRFAPSGIALVQSGHSLVSGYSLARRDISALIGATTRKKTTAAIDTNVIRLLTKSPYANVLPLIVNLSARKRARRRSRR